MNLTTIQPTLLAMDYILVFGLKEVDSIRMRVQTLAPSDTLN